MKILILLGLICIVYSSLTYQKVVVDNADAKCLDGSQSAYYISQGDQDKVLIFIEGGGWCGDNDLASTYENCYQRSKSALGSSTSYGPTQTFSNGILSDDKDNYFKSWTKVFLKYCDGSGHQGSRALPILYKGAELFFRGQNIKKAQFELINKNNKIFTETVTHLVLTGQSAGGLGAFLWTNYLADKISKTTKFWSIPDSGVFVDEVNIITKANSYRIWFQNLMKITNQQTKTPVTECNQAYPDQLWKCLFAQYIHPFIKVPLFAPQSLYDSWSLYNIVGIRCIDGISLSRCNKTELQSIESYHRATSQVLFQINSNNENGVWAPVCINHCYLSNQYYSSPNYRIPLNSDYSLIYSLQRWIQRADDTTRHIDFGVWPRNAPCSGVKISPQ